MAQLGGQRHGRGWQSTASKDSTRATESNQGGGLLLTHAVQEESFPEMQNAYSRLSEEEMSIFYLLKLTKQKKGDRYSPKWARPGALHIEVREQGVDFHIHKLCLF